MNRKWILPVIAILFVTVFAGCLGNDTKKPLIPAEFTAMLDPWEGYVDEGATVSQSSWNMTTTNITYVSVTLTWMDDEANTGADMMKLEVSVGEGNESQVSTEGDGGRLVSPPLNFEKFDGLTVSVTCVEAGDGPDQWPGPLIIYATPDNGNSFKVDVTYRFLEYV